MSDDELRIRARRLLAGDVRLEDLDRLFLEQRGRCHGRVYFREIGDFLAHRDGRDKGDVLQVIRDTMTSFRVWSMPMRDQKPSLDDIATAGEANLRLLTNQQLLSGCGMRRQNAATRLRKGIARLKSGAPLSQSEERAILYLGNHFVWRPAFNDQDLMADFVEVLDRNGIIDGNEGRASCTLKTTLALYAITRMHETVIKEGENTAKLYAGAANDQGVIEVKFDISCQGWTKPVTAPVCIFLTMLPATAHCDSSLPPPTSTLDWNAWNYPIELDSRGKLARLV